ncbi:hypothetical protein Bca101_018901 [Brassica carinata]
MSTKVKTGKTPSPLPSQYGFMPRSTPPPPLPNRKSGPSVSDYPPPMQLFQASSFQPQSDPPPQRRGSQTSATENHASQPG